MNYLFDFDFEKQKETNPYIEAIFVGIYTLIIYFFLSFFIKNPSLLLFFVGFIKHFSGDFIQLHTFYCNYGYACTYYFGKDNILHYFSDRKEVVILIESILEGFIFLFLGLFMFSFLNFERKWYWFLLFGFFLHIFFEKIGIHRLFCKYRCSSTISSVSV
jgi:hypothetical protein